MSGLMMLVLWLGMLGMLAAGMVIGSAGERLLLMRGWRKDGFCGACYRLASDEDDDLTTPSTTGGDRG